MAVVLDGRDRHPGPYGFREVVSCHATAAEALAEAARRETRGARREVPVLAEAVEVWRRWAERERGPPGPGEGAGAHRVRDRGPAVPAVTSPMGVTSPKPKPTAAEVLAAMAKRLRRIADEVGHVAEGLERFAEAAGRGDSGKGRIAPRR